MGADLIGNFIFLPSNLTENEKGVLKKHIEMVKEFTTKRKPIEWAQLYERDDEEVTNFLENMTDFAYELQEEIGTGDASDFEYAFEKLRDEYLPTMINFLEKNEIEEGRDTAWCTVNLLGRPIRVIFAGEMSWGDEPEGLGYQWTKKIYRGGLGDLLNKISFPTRASKHFIESLND